jgi:carbonic anhydrase
MRVDPGRLLELAPGESLIIRNIGGRITPGLLEELGMLGRIGQVMGQAPAGGGEFHLIVLQHTDCGITRLVGETAMLAHFFQIGEEAVAAKTVGDPRAAVAGDVALLKSIPALPGGWIVSGLVYDVATGLVEVVVPPGPIRGA